MFWDYHLTTMGPKYVKDFRRNNICICEPVGQSGGSPAMPDEAMALLIQLKERYE